MSKIICIIPAYNEENNIKTVIDSVKAHEPKIDILVINDGSTDQTSRIAKGCGVEVIDLICNLGIGGAVQTGYLYAKKNQYDIAIQFDGDGQHNAYEINKLIAPIEMKEADIVVGSRFLEKTEYRPSLARKAGITFFARLISLITKQHFTDTTSGFRAVNSKVICIFAGDYPSDYPEPESLVSLGKHNLRIREISVNMNERMAGNSSITPIKSIYYMIKVFLAIIITSIMQFDQKGNVYELD